jgi:hypothetical protein
MHRPRAAAVRRTRESVEQAAEKGGADGGPLYFTGATV